MHADPDLLALLALGELAGTEDQRRHAQICDLCRLELVELRRLVALGRESEETTTVAPDPAIWARICEELGFSLAVAGPKASPGGAGHPLSRWAAGTAVTGSDLRAHAELAPVGGGWSQATGRAELATDAQGRRLLQVQLHADLPADGVRQAWLVHRSDPNLRQTLGILDGLDGLWTVDRALDLTEYAILDISQQDTGQTEHSGQTIVRGAFTLIS